MRQLFPGFRIYWIKFQGAFVGPGRKPVKWVCGWRCDGRLQVLAVASHARADQFGAVVGFVLKATGGLASYILRACERLVADVEPACCGPFGALCLQPRREVGRYCEVRGLRVCL